MSKSLGVIQLLPPLPGATRNRVKIEFRSIPNGTVTLHTRGMRLLKRLGWILAFAWHVLFGSGVRFSNVEESFTFEGEVGDPPAPGESKEKP